MSQHRGEREDRPTGQCPDPRDQFCEIERLGQVVVRAQAQALDAVGDRACGGEHQHPARAPALGEVLADPVAVYAGQVPVQHDHVVAGHGDVVKRFLPIASEVHGHPLVPQPGRHRLGESLVIFHDQHSHALSQVRPPGPPGQDGWVRVARMPGAE